MWVISMAENGVSSGIRFERVYVARASFRKHFCIELKDENAKLLDGVEEAISKGESVVEDGILRYRFYFKEGKLFVYVWVLSAVFEAPIDSVKKWLSLWKSRGNSDTTGGD